MTKAGRDWLESSEKHHAMNATAQDITGNLNSDLKPTVELAKKMVLQHG